MKNALPRHWTTPAAVRSVIEGLWGDHPMDKVKGSWDRAHRGKVAALEQLLSAVNPAIIIESLSSDEGFLWLQRLSAIRITLKQWERGVDSLLNFDVVLGLHALLGKCPEEARPASEPTLTFVKHKALRKSIAADIDSMERLVQQQEWKAATVIGGSVVEALLLDALGSRRLKGKATQAELAHVHAKHQGWQRVEPLDKWDLWKLVAVASELKLLDGPSRSVCDAARGFRNLIHPGKARAEQPCDRGTALATVAAVEQVVRRIVGR